MRAGAAPDVATSVLDRARRGDHRAFATVVRHYDASLRALAYRLLSRGDRADTPTADSRAFFSPPPPRGDEPQQAARESQPTETDGAPTWRPPYASSRLPDEITDVPRMPSSGFLHDEAESTVRDRAPAALLPSSPPKVAPPKPPRVEKKK